MEIRHFRLVSKVAEVGSLSNASKELFLSQSALSHQLKELESELGTVIFHRVNKKLILSESGEVFLSFATRILNVMDEMNAHLNDIKGNKMGKIRISIEAYTSYHWLPSILKEFHEKFPNIEVIIKTDRPTKPIQFIKDRKLEFALMVSTNDDPNLKFESMFRDEVLVVVSKKHPFANKKFLEVSDFNEQNVITHAKRDERKKILENTYGEIQIIPKKFIHISQTQTILEMVEENLGIAILSKWAIASYVDENKLNLLKLGEHGTFRNWYLVNLKNKNQTEYEREFIKILKSSIIITE